MPPYPLHTNTQAHIHANIHTPLPPPPPTHIRMYSTHAHTQITQITHSRSYYERAVAAGRLRIEAPGKGTGKVGGAAAFVLGLAI